MADTANLENVHAPEGPDISHLEEDIQTVIDSKKPIDEKTGSHRATIKGLVDERGYQKGAFGDICKIARMSEAKRNDYLATLVPALQQMLPQWQDGQTSDLLGQDEETASTVHQLQQPAAE